MRFGHRLGAQLRHPRGLIGSWLGHAMALANARAYRETIGRLDVRVSDRVLELGFGPGRGIAKLAQRAAAGRVVGIDRSAVMLRQAARRNARAIRAGRVALVQGSFDALPFADGSFDRVLAVNVGYFWPPGGAVEREIDRVTGPDARVAVYVTHAASMGDWPMARGGSHRLFDETAAWALFAKSGFGAARIDVRTFPVGCGIQGICATASKGVACAETADFSRFCGLAEASP
jgi:SAM-dependent methyltransferase